MSKAFFDREEARLEVKDAEGRLEHAVADMADLQRAARATTQDWPMLQGWKGAHIRAQKASVAVKHAEEWLELKRQMYTDASEVYAKEVRAREMAQKREQARERQQWFREADNFIFHAHINAARARRWNGADNHCNDSVDDLYHKERGVVPSTYGRRQPLIMAELDRKGFTALSFRNMGVDRNDYVRGAVARMALPFIDVDNINAYKRRMVPSVPKPSSMAMPWLDPDWDGWDESDD